MFENVKLWKEGYRRHSKENPLRENHMMDERTFENDEERAKFISEFKEGFYKEKGKEQAIEVVRTINAGMTFRTDPIYYMDCIADQDDVMLSVAGYLAENTKDKSKQLREDYLSNKFIIALNRAGEYLGFGKYLNMSDEELEKDREIVFDEPDWSLIKNEELRGVAKEIKEIKDDVKKFYDDEREKTLKEVAEYNEKLYKEAMKELDEEKAKKKAKKKEEKEAEKEQQKKSAEEMKVSEKQQKNQQNQSVFKSSRGRTAVTKGVPSANSSNNNTPKSSGGGSGKKEKSSDTGDPDPSSSKEKINMDEVLPLEKVCPILFIDDEEEKKKLLEKAENDISKIITVDSGSNGSIVDFPANTGTAEQKIQKVADTLANGNIPDVTVVEDAIATADAELRQLRQNNEFKRTVRYETGRFTTKEINGRSDLELIQDSLNEACSSVPGVRAAVTPHPDLPDVYSISILKENFPEPVDKFIAYGSTPLGKGVPVLDGWCDYGGTKSPFLVPIHSILAVRENIFENIEVKNVNGEIVRSPQGTNVPLANSLMMSICADYNILDHLDLSEHSFDSNEEAAKFFHVMAGVLNKLTEVYGVQARSLPKYRVANYVSYKTFDLFGDSLVKRFPNRVDYSVYRKTELQETECVPDNRRIQVSGKNILITEPSGNKISAEIII